MTFTAPAITTEVAEQIRNTEDHRPWVREKAVKALVTAGHGNHVDPRILATTPVRSRYKGKFCATRHIDSLYGVVVDDNEVSHSVWFCPAAQNESGLGSWSKDVHNVGWMCSTCVHTEDWTEKVLRLNKMKQALREEHAPRKRKQAKTQFRIPTGARARAIVGLLETIGVQTASQIIGKVSNGLDKDMKTTNFTLYRLFRTGVIMKSGRGKKAVYRIAKEL